MVEPARRAAAGRRRWGARRAAALCCGGLILLPLGASGAEPRHLRQPWRKAAAKPAPGAALDGGQPEVPWLGPDWALGVSGRVLLGLTSSTETDVERAVTVLIPSVLVSLSHY